MTDRRPRTRHVDAATDEFQVLSSLRTNRAKRWRRRRFLVQGVRPIDQALAASWPLEALIMSDPDGLSDWARGVVAAARVDTHYLVAPDLLAELAERDEAPELLAVAVLPAPSIDDVVVTASSVICVCDRVQSPGNLGSIIRSCDAFGVDAVIVTERGADPFDPQTVRASTGSIFAVPVFTVASFAAVVEWAASVPASLGLRLVATHEAGSPIDGGVLDRPVAVAVGNEKLGLSRGAREACDDVAAIPMVGTASSLNAAVAASIVLHEATRGLRPQN